ncbi:MAG TPA: coenzyme F420-0:L-glutamate ligase [Candidatus Moranbacteria bacterium]|nr:coenzyme F420-0:L-glutamate ligase [Candidatus Moranbacteria bacterium]
MKIKSVKTHKIILGDNLFDILDKYISFIEEGSIIAITSKIVAICERRIVKSDKINKYELIEKEADFILDDSKKSKYGIVITIKNNLLIPTAGIDESNGNGYFILWPKNPQKTANEIRRYLKKKFRLKKLGIIITDSKTTPLRWGTSGVSIAFSGFSPLNNYIGKKDIFNKRLNVTKANVYDALASSAVLVMGEGNEQTPIAIIKDVSFLKFKNGNPTSREIKNLRINLKDDLYSSLFESRKWKKMKK